MKAIQIKYHGATNTLGARVSVQAMDCPRKYYPRAYGLDYSVQTEIATQDYIAMMGWSFNAIHYGQLDNDTVVAVIS